MVIDDKSVETAMFRDKVPLWRKVDGDNGLCICKIILVVCFILLNLVLNFFTIN